MRTRIVGPAAHKFAEAAAVEPAATVRRARAAGESTWPPASHGPAAGARAGGVPSVRRADGLPATRRSFCRARARGSESEFGPDSESPHCARSTGARPPWVSVPAVQRRPGLGQILILYFENARILWWMALFSMSDMALLKFALHITNRSSIVNGRSDSA